VLALPATGMATPSETAAKKRAPKFVVRGTEYPCSLSKRRLRARNVRLTLRDVVHQSHDLRTRRANGKGAAIALPLTRSMPSRPKLKKGRYYL
jgi:hypothetical protein